MAQRRKESKKDAAGETTASASSSASKTQAPSSSQSSNARQRFGSSAIKPGRRPLTLAALAPIGVMFAGMMAIWISVYRKYGASMFLGHKTFDLKHSPAEWKHILANKTILLIGGPHRGGTTLLWKAITSHPDISGLGSTFVTGVDYSEGILLQDVYPSMGVGLESLQRHQRKSSAPQGVGRYALAKEERVHLLPTDPRITPRNAAKVWNRFGAYWNLSQPILAEKSPPTAVMSRFLESLYNVPVFDNATDAIQVRFLFVTRHPIANALAHYNLLPSTTTTSLDTLLRNYAQIHTYLFQDMPHLQHPPLLVRLEDLCADPTAVLDQVSTWLSLPAEQPSQKSSTIPHDHLQIQSDPNAKYRAAYCGSASSRPDQLAWLQTQVDAWGLGYDVTGWCAPDHTYGSLQTSL